MPTVSAITAAVAAPAMPPFEYEHQQHGRRHVDDVDRNLQRQRQPGTRLTDQPAEHDVVRERHGAAKMRMAK